jgi:hypothetical protein
MTERGSVVIGALIFASVVGFLWMADFAARLTDQIQTERVMSIETRAQNAARAEWEQFDALIASLDPESSPATLEYTVADGLSTRAVRLRVVWEDGQWMVTERQAVWHATPVSH